MKVTLQQRVWADVRNHPGTSLNDVMARIGHNHRSSVSSILSLLESVDAISSKDGYSPFTPRKFTSIWETWKPEVIRKHYREYESRKKARPKPVLKVTDDKVHVHHAPVTPAPCVTNIVPGVAEIQVASRFVPEIPKRDKIEEIFNSLSLNECRELHRRLDHLFG